MLNISKIDEVKPTEEEIDCAPEYIYKTVMNIQNWISVNKKFEKRNGDKNNVLNIIINKS